jgi:hypothetical protein
VSMLFSRRGAKNFVVGTCPAEVGTAAFFRERSASAVECLFRLRTSLEPSPLLYCPAAFRRLFNSLNVTAYVPYSALNNS